jgi:dienelactone hydrolase
MSRQRMQNSRLKGPFTDLVDDIPVLWYEPDPAHARGTLVVWLPGLGLTKEDMEPDLRAMAATGLCALAFDPWQHGARGSETTDEIRVRVFSNFRRHMWPILGQTTLDTLRVIDWALAGLDVASDVFMGGLSMGGDIAVAAAGVDRRIARVAAIIATPDWLRPGMCDLFESDRLLPSGTPDHYAQYFYDHFDPLTHLEAYAHGPAITFECGEKDSHVPPDGALRFQESLRNFAPEAGARVRVNLHSGLEHFDYQEPVFLESSIAWLIAPGN